MEIASHPLIRPLGFVDEPVREALLSAARALIMPSPYESLSMVLLEAWNHGIPALVCRACGPSSVGCAAWAMFARARIVLAGDRWCRIRV